MTINQILILFCYYFVYAKCNKSIAFNSHSHARSHSLPRDTPPNMDPNDLEKKGTLQDYSCLDNFK